MKKEPDGYTEAEIEQRMREMIRRGARVGHKPLSDFVGKTDRAKQMRRTKLKRAIEKAKQASQAT